MQPLSWKLVITPSKVDQVRKQDSEGLEVSFITTQSCKFAPVFSSLLLIAQESWEQDIIPL